MAQPFGARDAYSYLTSRGYSPVQAATLAGNIQQESSFDPANVNQGEGAYGLLQWRLDRRKALEDYAASRGSSAADPYTQLDFIGQEMKGSEAKNAAPFLSATNLPDANAALKGYIRYGDDSEGTRLANAQTIAGGDTSSGSTPTPSPPATSAAGLVGNQTSGGLLGGSQPNFSGLANFGLSEMFPQLKPLATEAPPPMLRRQVDLSQLVAMLNQQPRPAGWGVS